MNVLQLISSQGHYGAENMLLHLCSSLRPLGCQVIAGVFENSRCPHLEVAEQMRSRGIPVEIIQCRGRFDWSAVRSIRNCIESRKIDVLHAHGYKSNFYGYAARPSGLPLVATCHNWPGKTIFLRAYYRLDLVVLKRFDKVVAVSEKISESLRLSKIPPSKICMIRNGIDVLNFRSRNESHQVGSTDQSKMRIGVVGRLVPEKGFHYFLHAAREILNRYPKTEILIVGDGPQRAELESLVRDFGIGSQVVFVGVTDNMRSVYSSVDMVVLPSLNEGLPLVLLEALAAGKPVVATNVGGIPSLITSGETGLLVEPRDVRALRDSVLHLLNDSSLRQKIGERGQKMVAEQFSAEAMADSYFKIYCELLGSCSAA